MQTQTQRNLVATDLISAAVLSIGLGAPVEKSIVGATLTAALPKQAMTWRRALADYPERLDPVNLPPIPSKRVVPHPAARRLLKDRRAWRAAYVRTLQHGSRTTAVAMPA